MREIKFRAWEGGKMVAFDFFIADIFALSENVMQFTGLLDKNGKEIYEGDIVEYENSNAGYGRPRNEEISRDEIPIIESHAEFAEYRGWWSSGEVIGNIYENPELVK